MGSIKKAIEAGFFSAGFLAIAWLSIVYITKMEFTFLALIFGAIVSAAVVIKSKGRGFLFQIIASFFTILGIVAGSTYGVFYLWNIIPEYYNQGPRPGVIELSWNLFLYDPATTIFYIVGVIGGGWVWHHGGADDY